MAVSRLAIVFRRDVRDNTIVACLPIFANTSGDMTVYSRVGQHGAGSLEWYRRCTVPVSEESEYADLLQELRGIYEVAGSIKLSVVKRLPSTRFWKG